MAGAATLFRSDVQRDVLRDLVLSADGTRTAADLARSTGHPPSSVAREVSRLVDAGLVRTTPHGRRHLLSVDYTDPFMAAVRDAFAAESVIAAERDRATRWWSTMPEVAERRPRMTRTRPSSSSPGCGCWSPPSVTCSP